MNIWYQILKNYNYIKSIGIFEMTIEVMDILKTGLPIIVMIGGWIYSFGSLTNRIKNLQQRVNQLSQVSEQVKEISKVLNQLVGKVDLFFSTFCKKEDK